MIVLILLLYIVNILTILTIIEYFVTSYNRNYRYEIYEGLLMKHEKASFDVLNKIQEERQKRGWTEYNLAKNSDLSQSTISSWYRKDLEPSLASIEKICNGLGITLSQFFSLEGYTNALSKEQKELIESWERLSSEQRLALLALLHSFIG